MSRDTFRSKCLLALVAMLASELCAQAEIVTISRGSGPLYLVSHVMERRNLVEAQARALGLADLAVVWREVPRQIEQTTELLADRVQIVNNGIGQLLYLHDRTGGRIKGIIATANHSVTLVTRDPKIRGLQDYGPGDRIAVSLVGASVHSLFLQMAAEQQFGAGGWNRLESLEAQMGQAEAFIALKSPGHDVRSHAASAPFDAMELAEIPGARRIIGTSDLPGNPRASVQFTTKQEYADAHPIVVAAVRNATMDAIRLIRSDLEAAVADYLANSNSKTDPKKLVALLDQESVEFSPAPKSVMLYARFLLRTGRLAKIRESWKDYFLDLPAGVNGD